MGKLSKYIQTSNQNIEWITLQGHKCDKNSRNGSN